MDTTDFDLEFYSKLPQTDEALRLEAERRLETLRAGHTDITGASVALEELSHGETPHLYQARVVAYRRPDNIVAVEKEETATEALKGALDALERQVRADREKRRQTQQQPEAAIDNTHVYTLTPREMYETYGHEADLSDLLNRDRTSIARELMTQEELDPKAAHYAADQMQKFAQETMT